ncbi:MAG: DUF2914 domain-containing protein [Candidatus Schekmanbacteria bacterium]|nr:DUF2914 domain-containing protein [Candidatus Schekmanbacteria bacterium]
MKKTLRIFMLILSCSLVMAGKPIQASAPEAVATLEAKPGFNVSRMVVCLSVDNKEPVGETNTFTASTQQVYCFVELADITDEKISMVWSLEDKEQSKAELTVKPGKRYRTYGSKNIYGKKGNWKVAVLDSQGNSVKDLAFKVEEGAPAENITEKP